MGSASSPAVVDVYCEDGAGFVGIASGARLQSSKEMRLYCNILSMDTFAVISSAVTISTSWFFLTFGAKLYD